MAIVDALPEVTAMNAECSSDKRSDLEAAVGNLASKLRDHPTLPADMKDASKPCIAALSEDAAMTLPVTQIAHSLDAVGKGRANERCSCT